MDYQKFLNESLIDFVKKILAKVGDQGLIGNHHFYISFVTEDQDVKLSTRMKQLYPKEITIVLQNQYENLIVMPNAFSVKLSFNGIAEVIEVPFRCLTNFADPSVNFSLQFNNYLSNNDSIPLIADRFDTIQKANKKPILSKIEKTPDNIIVLDRFRNKNKPQ